MAPKPKASGRLSRTLLCLSLLCLAAQAQEPTAVPISWGELEAGCESLELSSIPIEHCQVQHARWQADYQSPLQQPDLLSATLDRVLSELPMEPEAGLSLWGQIWEWLKAQFGDGEVNAPSWLKDWQLPEQFIDWLLGISLGACVLLALGIVGNELLQVYRGRALGYAPGASGWEDAKKVSAQLPTLSEIGRYPAQEQPGLLLRIVLDRLQKGGLLPRRGGRTHQDLLQQAPSLGNLGDSLTLIAQAAERSTYGGWQITPMELEPLLDAGQTLVAQADASQVQNSGADA